MDALLNCCADSESSTTHSSQPGACLRLVKP